MTVLVGVVRVNNLIPANHHSVQVHADVYIVALHVSYDIAIFGVP